MSTTNGAVGGELAEQKPGHLDVISDYKKSAQIVGSVKTSHISHRALPTMITYGESVLPPDDLGQLVSSHILEMPETSTQENLRALDEIRTDFIFYVANARKVGGFESQSVQLTPRIYDLQPLVDSSLPTMWSSNRIQALGSFLNSIVAVIHEAPEAHWRNEALKHLSLADEESPWAEALGLLYSLPGMSAVMGVPADELVQAVEKRILLGLRSSEGDLLFPAAQLRRDGKLVRGLQWILANLAEDIVDSYTVAGWLNMPHEALGGSSVWERLADSAALPGEVHSLVESFKRTLAE